MDEIVYWIWLSSRRGAHIRHRLLHALGSAEAVYCAETYEEEMPLEILEDLLDKSLEEAERMWKACQQLDIQAVTIRDEAYPSVLRSIYNPPIVLYIQGEMPDWSERLVIGMVGTRQCSSYGGFSAERLGFELAGQGAVVVSGLATGVDAAAHQGALRIGGDTVAVIGCGHDVVYPKENAWLYEEIGKKGTILSEYGPGTLPKPNHFPARNRIISGLCRAVVVVEAPIKSGAIITAKLAAEQGRDVYAVPGPLYYPNSEGCYQLLQDGAKIISGGADLLQHYQGYPLHIQPLPLPKDLRISPNERWTAVPLAEPPKQSKRTVKMPESADMAAVKAERQSIQPKKPVRTVKPAQPPAPPAQPPIDHQDPSLGLSADEILVLEHIGEQPMRVDDVIEETGLLARQVSAALMMLQLAGLVEKKGMYYERSKD